MQILESVPGLTEAKDGKFILLTLDSELGRALFEACQSSKYDDGHILARAVMIVRKQMFSEEEVFGGDLSRGRQVQSVPSVLTPLVQLIIEGSDTDSNLLPLTQKIASNIISTTAV